MSQTNKQPIARNPNKDKIENVPQDKVVENFVARHFKHILIFSLGVSFFTFAFSSCNVKKQSEIIQKQEEIISNLSNKVIFVRPDGKVAVLDKEPISDNALKYIIRDISLNLVPLTAFDLRGITKVEDLMNIEKFKRVLAYLSDNGKAGYKAYRDTIISYYNAGKLPEVILSYDYSKMSENIIYKDGKFVYKLYVPVEFMYVSPSMKWETGVGDYEIELSGSLNLPDGTPENPFGIKIDEFKVNKYISKPYL